MPPHRARILNQIPFMAGAASQPRRTHAEEVTAARNRARNDQEVLDAVVGFISDFYSASKRDWSNKYWHSAISKSDVAAEHALRTSQIEKITDAFSKSVAAECDRYVAEIDTILDKDKGLGSREIAESLVLLISNFVHRTIERVQLANVIDTMIFRQIGSNMAENALETFSEIVLTPGLTTRVSDELVRLFRLDAEFGLSLAMSYMGLFNEPGMICPESKPWCRIVNFVWNDICVEIETIIANDTANLALNPDPRELVKAVNGWLLNSVYGASYGFQLVTNVRNHAMCQDVILYEDAWVEKLGRTPGMAHGVWADFALLAVRDPLVCDSTLKILRGIYAKNGHNVWGSEDWPDLFDAIIDKIQAEYSSSILQYDAAWRIFATLQPGISSLDEGRFREAFLKQVFDRMTHRFYADLYFVMLENHVGDSSASRHEDGTELEQVILGKNSRMSRFNENLLLPIPSKLARSITSALIFVREMLHTDIGNFENELYMEVARCHLPQPAGRGIAPSSGLIHVFEQVTFGDYRHLSNLISTIERGVAAPTEGLILNSGTWMSATDPYLSTDLKPDVLNLVVRPRADANVPDQETPKVFKWHRSWSTVTCELNGGQFSCSWVQLEMLELMLSSPEPLSESDLVPDMPFETKCLEDLVKNANGFIKQSEFQGIKYYAIDSSVVPEGNWVTLEFSDMF